MEKGRKAWFKIKKTITLNNPCNLLDSLVVPIILYGSEVWSVSTYNKFRDSDLFEHLHLNVMKEILGVQQCKTTNVACLAETNRTPLHLRIKLSAIKLLDHIVNSPNTLVNKIYINTEKTNKWVTTIKEWINKLGIGHLNFNTNNSKFYTISIQQRIQDQAKQNMNSLINVCEKFF